MNSILLEQLKTEAKKALDTNTRFHDFGHALEVLENTKKILEFEKGDEDILFASALFHDVSNQSGKLEGDGGANIARKILTNVADFPQNKIDNVCRLIKSISGDTVTRDEIIINEADRMAIFSKLSIVRGFMIYGGRGVQPIAAIEDFLALVENKYRKFKIPKAKELIENDYVFIKNFLTVTLQSYS